MEATATAVLALGTDAKESADLGTALLGGYNPYYGWGDGRANLLALRAVVELFKQPVPANVRIVATSNRRHLIPQRVRDNREARLDADSELHVGETLEEKLALADRFGLVLGFYGFPQPTYLRIVERYAAKAGIALPEAELHAQALRFALDRSSRSGRVAKQFVDDLAGRLALERQAQPG